MAQQTINEKIFDKVLEVSEAVAVMVPIVADLKKAVMEEGGLSDRVKCIETLHASQAQAKDEANKKKEKIMDKWDARAWIILIFTIEQFILLGFLFAKAKFIV